MSWDQLLFPFAAVIALMIAAFGAVALAKAIELEFEPDCVKRDEHWNVTHCTECGGRIADPVNTMTRDEYCCGKCAA